MRLNCILMWSVLVSLLLAMNGGPTGAQEVVAVPPPRLSPDELPVQFEELQLRIQLVEATRFIHAQEAREQFSVSGAGLTVAVLDTGLRVTHKDFRGRVRAKRNFTTDDGGNPDIVTDGSGHGTNVAGIVCANDLHIGIAPGAGVIPLKVLASNGLGSFTAIDEALQWVLDNRITHNITVVSMSLGSPSNLQSDVFEAPNAELRKIQSKIQQLRQDRIAVVIAAGNDFLRFRSQQGMAFPAIIRESISVGAVYDADVGPFSYQSGARANKTGAGFITPFTQRLHKSASSELQTDIFAPGAPITSSGSISDSAESVQHGTSQATPITSGVVLLMQQFFYRSTGELPTIDQLEDWLRRSGPTVNDGDDEDDNVENTGLDFRQIDALAALEAIRRDLTIELLHHAPQTLKLLYADDGPP